MTTVVTFGSHKGGVGKTTSTVSVAHGLAMQDHSVVVVDFDPQGQVAVAFGLDKSSGIFNALITQRPLKEVALPGRANLIIIPGDKRTSTTQTVMHAEAQNIFKEIGDAFVKPLKGRVDYILFDTSPSVGGFQEAAMFNADIVIAPIATDYLSLFGFMGTLETATVLRKQGWSGKVVALPTFYDERTSHSKQALTLINDRLIAQGIHVLDPIHEATDLKNATREGKTIFEYAPKSRAAQEYANVVWAIKRGKL